MGNARRDSRHRVEGLQEVGLREPVRNEQAERRHHPDRMTRRAVAALVGGIGLIVLRAPSSVVICAIVTAHIHMMPSTLR